MMGDRSSLLYFQWLILSRTSRQSTWPTISSMVRNPSSAMISRSSWVRNLKKLTTWSASPVKRARNSGFWVATPTGQVFRWHLRIRIQPSTTRAVVASPHSSAPNNVATAMSRPVFNCPSVWRTTRLRSLFLTRVWWDSARPSSQGRPACLIELMGEAPVPPSWPEIRITSDFAFATPAAMVPTPAFETSFTLMRALRLAFFRSKISCARSSME